MGTTKFELKLQEPQKFIKNIVITLLIVIGLLILNPFVIIHPGHRGVIVTLGAVSKTVMNEGINFKIPLIQKITQMNVQVQKFQIIADSASKDLQTTHSTIALNFHVLPEHVNTVYQTISEDYQNRIIEPALQEVVKAVTAQYTAIALISEREKARSEIKNILKDRLIEYNLVVDDLSIVNFKFSEQFTQAIESKQEAEQKALKAQRDLERIKIEAEQKIASARAEAEALRLQKENVTAQLIQLRQIEATMKAIEKWDGQLPTYTGGAMPFINLDTVNKK